MSYKIIGKYIKELKFNIPNPKTFFLLAKDIANYKINIDIKSAQIKQNVIEVLISLSLNPNKDNFEKIETNIVFSVVIEFINEKIGKEEMENIILIDVPSKIYPELRRERYKFDLHGFSLDEANSKVKEVIDYCVKNKYRELLLITGKGIHSKSDKDTYKF